MNTNTVVSILKLAHACFAAALFCGFAYQGLLGWRIRSRRSAGVLQDFGAQRRHRRLGPLLAALLPTAYLGGLITVYLHRGVLVHHGWHLAGGSALLVLAAAAWAVSRTIRGPLQQGRTPHVAAGAVLLLTFGAQIALGLALIG